MAMAKLKTPKVVSRIVLFPSLLYLIIKRKRNKWKACRTYGRLSTFYAHCHNTKH